MEMKPYVKPELFYESFELSQHIAVCGLDMSNLKDVDVCTADTDPDYFGWALTHFTETNENCTYHPGDGIVESYCYEVSEDMFKIFNS